jgi:hypothetical protein
MKVPGLIVKVPKSDAARRLGRRTILIVKFLRPQRVGTSVINGIKNSTGLSFALHVSSSPDPPCGSLLSFSFSRLCFCIEAPTLDSFHFALFLEFLLFTVEIRLKCPNLTDLSLPLP